MLLNWVVPFATGVWSSLVDKSDDETVGTFEMLDDAGLGRFALGIVPVAGVLLAVLASLLVFILSRLGSDECDVVDIVRSAANRIYQLILTQASVSQKYFESLETYNSFEEAVLRLTFVESTNLVPDYISWRTRVAELISTAPARNAVMGSMDDKQRQFHATFMDSFFDLGIL